MKFVLTALAFSTPTLDAAHAVNQKEIGSIQFRSLTDLEFAARRVPWIAAQHCPLSARPALIASLQHLSDRANKSDLDPQYVGYTVGTITTSIAQIESQPEKMPTTATVDRHAKTDQADGQHIGLNGGRAPAETVIAAAELAKVGDEVEQRA
ncbi:MAG TPA: hypothetical protein VJH91_02300 [Candidatus Paceibacterota bacterium]